MFMIYSVQYSTHKSHVAFKHVNVAAVTEETVTRD